MIGTILAGHDVEPRVRAAAELAAPFLERTDTARVRVKMRVIGAFLAAGISESDLWGSTGYGYDDPARDRYEALLARYFAAEKVLARLSIVSGTHAIVAALDALTAPGETLLCANGAPYDTLAFAIARAPYSLVARGIVYAEIPRALDGSTDLAALAGVVRDRRPAVVFVQRSRGYAARRSLRIDDIGAIVEAVRRAGSCAPVVVDNCYGELVEDREPLEAGADLAIGSLIKNLGGGIAPTGGYIAGRAELVDRIAARIYAPGIGARLGPTLGVGRAFIQGFFYAPLVVGEALRGLNFAAALFAELGFAVDPAAGDERTDIVQAIRLSTPQRLLAFARGLQRVLPVNARFAPEPGAVPGYVDPVVMSSGSFVSGSTIDLSCDAPMREPYEVYLQGGITAEHTALGAVAAATEVVRSGQKMVMSVRPDDAQARLFSRQTMDSVPPSRRQFARIAVDFPATFAIGHPPDWENCSVVNLGGGGLRIQTRYQIAATVSTISIRFAFEGLPVVAKAKVVDSTFDRTSESYFSSAAFTSIDPAHQQRIVQRVVELRASPPNATTS